MLKSRLTSSEILTRTQPPTGRDPATGARTYHSETVHGPRTKAEKRCTKLLAQLDDGTFFEPSRKPVKDFLKEWLDQKRREGVRGVTVQSYKDVADIYIVPRIGEMQLARVTPRDVQDLYNHMHDRGLSESTIGNARKVLKMALRQAVAWRYIAASPAADVKAPRPEGSEGESDKGRAMDEAEARAFLQAAREDPEDLIFVFWLCTGLRPEEMLGLQWRAVELDRRFDSGRETFVERGVAHILRTAVRIRGGGWEFGRPKSASGVRDVYFPAHVYRELEAHRNRQAERARGLGRGWVDNDLIFPASNGEPQDRCNLTVRRFKPLLRRAGLSEGFTLYSLRYTYATLSLLAGESDKVVSGQMGHKRVNFTKDVYVKVLPRMKQAASDRLENLLFSDVGTHRSRENDVTRGGTY